MQKNSTTGALEERDAPLEDALIERTLQAIDLTTDLKVPGRRGVSTSRILHSIRSAFKSLGSSGGEWFVPRGR